MIKIIYTDKSLSISGHANSDRKGKDLVCAAVSGIYLSALSWFNSNEIELSQVKDTQKLTIVKPTSDNKYKLSLLIKQLDVMAYNCPKSIKISKGK